MLIQDLMMASCNQKSSLLHKKTRLKNNYIIEEDFYDYDGDRDGDNIGLDTMTTSGNLDVDAAEYEDSLISPPT